MLKYIQHCQCSSAAHRMSRVGVAMIKLQQVLSSASVHERLVNRRRSHHSTHGNRAISQLLGEGHDIRQYPKHFRCGHRPAATQASNHLVEDQQDLVFIANGAQTLQVTQWWRHDTPGADHRFDDNRCNLVSPEAGDKGTQFFGQAQPRCGSP